MSTAELFACLLKAADSALVCRDMVYNKETELIIRKSKPIDSASIRRIYGLSCALPEMETPDL